jgi:2Fe-2S ferredoxin
MISLVELVFIEPSGAQRRIEVEEGQSVMRAARDAGVAGIIGECGGCLTCGTCHVFVTTPGAASFPPPGSDESEMIATLLRAQPNSRLSCQLRASARDSGLVLSVPPDQG